MPKHPYASLKFEKFRVEGGWNSYDCLGKKHLESGEFLILKWPDGTFEKVSIRVYTHSESVSDMGVPATETHTQAHATIDHGGASLTVRLTSIKGLMGASLKQKD